MPKHPRSTPVTLTKAAPGPRIAVCRFPGELRISGSRGFSVLVTAGAHLDLDQIVGDCGDQPQTVADLLGSHLQHFEIVGGESPTQTPADDAPDQE